MIHVFFCGGNRSVISFNLYVSLAVVREIKGPANESCRIRFRYDIRSNRNIESRLIAAASRLVSKKMKFLFTSWSLVGWSLDLERECTFFLFIFRCRIHFVLRLIVEFMDKFRLADEFFKEASCVTRSKQISLASLLRLVWDRMKTMPDSISRHTVSQINKVDSS